NKDDGSRVEQGVYREQPKDFKALDQPEFGDQVMVKYNRGGKWSEPIAITDAKQDIMRCAIAVQSDGKTVVAYSAQRNGKYDVYARGVTIGSDKGKAEPVLSREQKLTARVLGG